MGLFPSVLELRSRFEPYHAVLGLSHPLDWRLLGACLFCAAGGMPCAGFCFMTSTGEGEDAVVCEDSHMVCSAWAVGWGW